VKCIFGVPAVGDRIREIEPGQPWVMTRGVAFASGDFT